MRCSIVAVIADVRRRMSPAYRQSVAQISAELGIHVVTLYNWRKAWRLQGEVVLASDTAPEGWSATDKFTVVLETAGLNATELSAHCRERGLLPEQVERWRQASQYPATPNSEKTLNVTANAMACRYWHCCEPLSLTSCAATAFARFAQA
jgi:transposase-like protein